MIHWAYRFDRVLGFRLKFLDDISRLEASWNIAQYNTNPFDRFLDLPSIITQPNFVWDSRFIDQQVVELFKDFEKQLKLFGLFEFN